MRQVTETFTVYKFSDAPKEVKEKIREKFHYDYDLYDYAMEERVETLKKFAELLQADLDYSLSCVPDRGDFISLKPHYLDFDYESLKEVLNKDCPLTGVCYDHDILEHFKGTNFNDDTLKMAFNNYIKSIHDEYEWMLKDDYLSDLCEANEYEFTSDGKIY